MMATKTLLNSKDLARGNIKDSDFGLIIEKADFLVENNNIYINTKPNLSIGEIIVRNWENLYSVLKVDREGKDNEELKDMYYRK